MTKVLLVDDAAFMRLAMRSLLEKNGFEVIGEAVMVSAMGQELLLKNPLKKIT